MCGLQTCLQLLRSLFFNMAMGKFLDVQAAFGSSGLHAKLVDAALEVLRGPVATPAMVRICCWSLIVQDIAGADWACHFTPGLTALRRRRNKLLSCVCSRRRGWSTLSHPCRG